MDVHTCYFACILQREWKGWLELKTNPILASVWSSDTMLNNYFPHCFRLRWKTTPWAPPMYTYMVRRNKGRNRRSCLRATCNQLYSQQPNSNTEVCLLLEHIFCAKYKKNSDNFTIERNVWCLFQRIKKKSGKSGCINLRFNEPSSSGRCDCLFPRHTCANKLVKVCTTFWQYRVVSQVFAYFYSTRLCISEENIYGYSINRLSKGFQLFGD